MLCPSTAERAVRDAVLEAVDGAVRSSTVILLPRPTSFDDLPSETALHRAGIEANLYGGHVGDFRYQFEGEDDLLHLFVVRLNGCELTPEDGQAVAAWVLDKVPPGLVWFKPGRYTQHFYLGHDDLVAALGG